MRALPFLTMLAACSAAPTVDAPVNATDPAIADAMAGPIMSDMGLSGAAAPDALMPGEQPATLPVPLDALIDTDGAPTLGEVARARLAEPAFAGCDPKIAYSALYSVKLPAPLALPKVARLSEAAGSDRAGCALRIVRFAVPGAPQKALDGYARLAQNAGLTVGRGASEIRASGAARTVHVTAVASRDGTRVDLAVRSR